MEMVYILLNSEMGFERDVLEVLKAARARLKKERVEKMVKTSKPCMFCGKELRAKYPYYKLLKQENGWKAPKTVGRICEECIKKMRKRFIDDCFSNKF